MSHLLAGLLRLSDPWLLGLTVLEAGLGSAVAFHLCFLRLGGRRMSPRQAGGFGLVTALTAWVVFRTALHVSYADLPLHTPLAWVGPALLFAVLGSGVASFNQGQAQGHRSARNAMLSGSLAASGLSCMLFTAMAGVVQPFTLAYDLSAVFATALMASMLFSLAFWEATNPERRHRRLVATGLSAGATMVTCLGSLASILPFDGWMTSLTEPDNLASTPLMIIGASETAVVLGLSLFGSLVDNRAAARGRLETERLRELAGSTFEAIVIHRDGIVLDGNDVLASLSGQSLPMLVGRNVAELCPDNTMLLWSDMISDRSPQQANLRRSGGDAIPVEVLSRRISYAGRPAVASALRDVRERRASEARIRFLAHHDTLTELPNRALMTDTLDEVLARCARDDVPFSVFCLDLDGFKLVNDTLGHAAGDRLLCEVAQRLRTHIRANDFVARLGGDEFVVLSMATPAPVQSAGLARRLVEALAAPFPIEGKDVRIGTSIGIAIYPQDGTEAATLLRHADIALYRAKQDGRGTFCFFKPDMGEAIEHRSRLEHDLQGALERDEISLHFQPLFDRDRSLVSFEALLRWAHPVLGQVSPSDFIPIAEKSGVITGLGEWMLRTACTTAMSWPDPFRLAVNISPRQLLRGNLAEIVGKILDDTGLPPFRLELEITESALLANSQGTLATMAALRSLGVRLVLDDFGTGYSSLSYLHRFSFHKLKIDRSFVQRLEHDPSARSIVRAITAMCCSLRLEVTAEGVETAGQLKMLIDEGCHELQGYLLGRPMPEAALMAFIAMQPGRFEPAGRLEGHIAPAVVRSGPYWVSGSVAPDARASCGGDIACAAGGIDDVVSGAIVSTIDPSAANTW